MTAVMGGLVADPCPHPLAGTHVTQLVLGMMTKCQKEEVAIQREASAEWLLEAAAACDCYVEGVCDAAVADEEAGAVVAGALSGCAES